ncbi:MAG: hypothetical protein ISS92_06145 [Candidatus Omnitrophica bacterium]|nr:hypothetical protein [Candidatus Omnitrophota bacterium]
MIFKWKTRKEKLKKYSNIPPQQKLEWIRQMNEFFAKYANKKTRAIRQKLREAR